MHVLHHQQHCSHFVLSSLPPRHWVESLHTSTYLLNRLPTTAYIPYTALYNTLPTYEHLRVFGCACYPNLSTIAPYKLTPRSTWYVFIGYSLDHKGYCCLYLSTNRVVISQDVIFMRIATPS
jgi:hypothetical protein